MGVNYAIELEACLRGVRRAVRHTIRDATRGLPSQRRELISCLEQIATLRGRLDRDALLAVREVAESDELRRTFESIRRSALDVLATAESSLWDIWRLAHRLYRAHQRPVRAAVHDQKSTPKPIRH